MRSIQTYEFIRMNGWSSFFRETFYRGRRAIIFEKDLLATSDHTEAIKLCGAEMIEITAESIAGERYYYRYRNRLLKAGHYLEKGYAGYGAVRGKEVVGELWYCTDPPADGNRHHPDLAWLGITLSPKDVYAFDMFLTPGERRGNNLAGSFQNQALYSLRKKGYLRAFAYVWADNSPALWNTRSINKWKEIRTEKMTRFLIGKMHQ